MAPKSDPKPVKTSMSSKMHFVVDFVVDLGGNKKRDFGDLSHPERTGGGQCYLLIDHRGQAVVVRSRTWWLAGFG